MTTPGEYLGYKWKLTPTGDYQDADITAPAPILLTTEEHRQLMQRRVFADGADEAEEWPGHYTQFKAYAFSHLDKVEDVAMQAIRLLIEQEMKT